MFDFELIFVNSFVNKVLANFLATPLASGIDGDAGWPYVAFDLDPSVVKVGASEILEISNGNAPDLQDNYNLVFRSSIDLHF